MLNICEIFSNTKQGEGPFSGINSTFIRTAKCQPPFCKHCDTKYSWKDGKQYTVQQVLKEIQKYKCNFAVITGGEPFIQSDIYNLINLLNEYDYKIQIETSGKVPFDKVNAHVVCCPKIYDGVWYFKADVKHIDTFKFVAGNKDDFKQIIEFIRVFNIKKNNVYIMPLNTFNKEKDNKIKKVVWEECVKNDLRFTLRLHVEVFGKKRGI